MLTKCRAVHALDGLAAAQAVGCAEELVEAAGEVQGRAGVLAAGLREESFMQLVRRT